ncbi:MAG: DUF1295 domain-containing protein [Acidobacteriota bacterium]
MLTLILGGLLAAITVFGLLWLVQRLTGNASIVDIAWPYGIGLTALAFGVLSSGYEPRRALVATLGAIWSFRLGSYILKRVLTMPEDKRYETLREQHKDNAQTFFFFFYQFQAVTVVLFALPMLIAMRRIEPLDIFDAVGVVLWLTAVLGEAIADAQLNAFRTNPANKGKVCNTGLWRYSRHPNYFFEWLHWFTYVAIGITAPLGWLTLLGPALMLYFLWKVTGIPVTEQHMLESRGDAYRRYQQTTSIFVPWFPRAAKL